MDSELRFRRLFEAAQDGILILDARTGLITDVNPFLSKLLDHSQQELVGRALWDIDLLKDPETARTLVSDVVEQDQVHYDEISLKTRSGMRISVELLANLYHVEHEVIQIHVRDIRQRKNVEEFEDRLRQAQKMEAIGQLAGGVAHDFNNLLGVILGYCELLEERKDLGEFALKMIREIHSAGTSARNLTQRLLVFSRRQKAQPVPLNLNDVVNRMEKMLSRLIGEDVLLLSILSENLHCIHADPSHIEQVLMNLAINSRDAMPGGGRILIQTENIPLDALAAESHPSLSPGDYVRLSFTDSGEGMDRETQSHIFEPFFSTKAPGEGTGLGLSTVFGIVSQGNGAIGVYSEPGRGTTFKIYFPRYREAADEVLSSAASNCCGGTETILVVDDAAPLRQLTRRILEESGYTVLESGDPAEALRIAEFYPGPLPLVMTDVVMPGCNGFVLGERILQKRPDTRVLYVSGYNEESIAELQNSSSAFLEKPFTREDLLSKIRELLDESPKAGSSGGKPAPSSL